MHLNLMRSCETPSDPTRSEMPPWPLSRASVRLVAFDLHSQPDQPASSAPCVSLAGFRVAERVRGICL